MHTYAVYKIASLIETQQTSTEERDSRIENTLNRKLFRCFLNVQFQRPSILRVKMHINQPDILSRFFSLKYVY